MNLRSAVERAVYACRIAECCGCDATSPLVAFDNGHHYCARCADEVQANGWAKRC